jgi:chromosome partitioning protein
MWQGGIMILVVGGEKGGTGKSCLAQQLAVHYAQQPNRNVILVDCEPQRSSSDWVQLRQLQPGVPWINCVQMYGNIRYELKSLQHHYDVVIVDCGGHDLVALRSAMAVANHALFPVQPRIRDLASLHLLSTLRQSSQQLNPQLATACVLNQCPALEDERVQQAKAAIGAAKLPLLEAQVCQRDIYDQSAAKGLSVLDVEPTGAAAAEINRLAQELKLLSMQFSLTGTN